VKRNKEIAMRAFVQNLALFASLSSAAAMPALAGDLEDPGLEQLAVESYVDNFRVGVEEATRRVRLQDRAAGIEDRIEALLGEQFAGVWFDHDDRGRIKIGITRAAVPRSGEVQRIVADFGLGDDAQLVSVRHTVAELDRSKQAIREFLLDMMRIGHVDLGYDTRSNQVIVTTLALLPSYEEARIAALAGKSEVTIRRVDAPTLGGELVSCTIGTCDPPLRGGRALDRCTGGFIARHRVNTSHLLVLTAGHCLTPGYDVPWYAKNENLTDLMIGPSYGYVFGLGSDAGAIYIDPSRWWFSPAPVAKVVVESSPFTAYNPNYKIKHDSTSTIGKVVCYSGRITKTRCGVISALGVDYYIDGALFLNMGEMTLASCPALGDSGSPIYKINRGYGLLVSRHYWSEGQVDKCLGRYQGIRGAENQLNVDILLSP
jgi:hypothetical protein